MSAAAVVAAVVGGLVGSPPALALHQRVLAHVEAKTSSATKRLPASFLGLSLEYSQILKVMGVPFSKATNSTFVQLVRNLTTAAGSPPTMRIGGGTADQTYLQRLGKPAPGNNIRIEAKHLRTIAGYQTQTGSPLILGVNLAQNRPDLAATFVKAMELSQPPGSIRDFEIGNEPDYYFKRPYGPGLARAPSYGPRQFVPEFRATSAAVREAAPSVELAGAGFLGVNTWDKGIKSVFRAVSRDGVRLVTIHRYALNGCNGKGRFAPTIANLLSPYAVEGFFKPLAKLTALARKNHERIRMTETNSIACGGKRGVSNTFAAALWATDWLFLLDAMRFDGADIHFGAARYTPFTTFHTKGRHGAMVRPLYYAMLLFAEATAHRAHLLTSAFRGARGQRGRVHSWATYDAVDHVVRVVINNKGRRSGYAVIHVPGAHGHATLKRLTASGPADTDGATWGGQAAARPTFDGTLVGTPRIQLPKRRRGSKFRIRVPEYSVALLTVPVRRR